MADHDPSRRTRGPRPTTRGVPSPQVSPVIEPDIDPDCSGKPAEPRTTPPLGTGVPPGVRLRDPAGPRPVRSMPSVAELLRTLESDSGESAGPGLDHRRETPRPGGPR
jgi:hypothetical protein